MARIVVLGSLMQDFVIRAPRLPNPGETIFGREFSLFVGGKGGNQAIAAARLGAEQVLMLGRVGSDPFGDAVVETLTAAGVDTAHVTRDPVAGTGVALPIVLDDGSNSIISIPRANLAVSPDDVERARAEIESADALLLQFEVAMDANLAAASIARSAGVPVVLNAAPVALAPPELVEAASVLVVNEVEADAFTRCDGNRLDQARQLRRLGPRIAVVTLGASGAVAAADSFEGTVPAFRVRAVDTVGAGDAFCAAIALELAAGTPLEDALRLANAAGAVAVTKPGAAASLPTRLEIEHLLRFGTIS